MNCTVKSVILLFNEQLVPSLREKEIKAMMFYAKDFGILPESEISEKIENIFSEISAVRVMML